jgi:hypothetical protein
MNGIKLKFDAQVDIRCLCRRVHCLDGFGGLEPSPLCPMHGGDKTAARVSAAIAYLSDVQHERDTADSLQRLLDAVLGMTRAHAEAVMAGSMSAACEFANGFGALWGEQIISRKAFPMMDVARAAYEGMLPADLKTPKPKKTTCPDGTGRCKTTDTI